MLFAAIQGFLQCFSFSKGHLKGKVFLEACVFLKYQKIRLRFYQDVCVFLIASAENSTVVEDGGVLFSPYLGLELGFRSWIKWCKNSYLFEKNQIFAFKRKVSRFLLNILKLIFMLIQAWEQSGRLGKVKFACNIKENTQMILRTTHLVIQALDQSVRCPHILALRSRCASRIVPEWPLARLWTGSLSQNPPGVKWGSQTSPPLSWLLSTLNYPPKHVFRKHPQKSSTEVILLPTCMLGCDSSYAHICSWRSGNTTAQVHNALIVLGGLGWAYCPLTYKISPEGEFIYNSSC